MAGTITVTGVAGPAIAVTAQVFTNITSLLIDMVGNVITMQQGSVTIPPISINAATTVTVTKSAATWTVTIS